MLWWATLTNPPSLAPHSDQAFLPRDLDLEVLQRPEGLHTELTGDQHLLTGDTPVERIGTGEGHWMQTRMQALTIVAFGSNSFSG